MKIIKYYIYLIHNLFGIPIRKDHDMPTDSKI